MWVVLRGVVRAWYCLLWMMGAASVGALLGVPAHAPPGTADLTDYVVVAAIIACATRP